MKISDDDSVYPQPPIKGGRYVVSLHRPINWYVKRAILKGKTFGTSNVKIIVPTLIGKIFGEIVDQEELNLALNLDCMIGSESDFVLQEMEHLILGEVLSYFPQLGAIIPDYLYHLNEKMELIINVPNRYEDQRGYFF
jgi:hypothetical protein